MSPPNKNSEPSLVKSSTVTAPNENLSNAQEKPGTFNTKNAKESCNKLALRTVFQLMAFLLLLKSHKIPIRQIMPSAPLNINWIMISVCQCGL